MIKLEDIVKDSWVKGIIPNEEVKVERADFIGSNSLEVFYTESSGNMGKTLLSRDDEIRLIIEEGSRSFSFDAPGDKFKLAAEAYRIRLAHVFDVHTSLIDPLPHVIRCNIWA